MRRKSNQLERLVRRAQKRVDRRRRTVNAEAITDAEWFVSMALLRQSIRLLEKLTQYARLTRRI